jgi:predicted porin
MYRLDGLYYRREWGYLGTDRLGTIRLGSTDSPSSLYMTGNFENFNDGGWNGDVPALMAGRTQITWPFADVGATYSTTKAVYLSPQFYGFDFGVGYAPNSGAVSNTNGCGSGSFNGVNFVNPASAAAAGTVATNANAQGVSGPGCDRLSSTAAAGELARYKNFVDALVRYRGTFGPVGLAATAAFIGSGKINDSATPGRVTALTTGAGGAVTGSTAAYTGLKVGDFGVALTYAGFSVGGKYQFGQVNNQWQLNPTGLPDSQAWLVGASYTMGPMVVGAHYLDYQFAGDLTNALQGRQRREKGLAAGATYSLAPGVSLFASYLWGQFQQNGVNQITGQNTGVAGTQNNKLTANAFALGTSFSW